jgi:hypothetical protein
MTFDEQLVELWAAGATLSEICAELGSTRGSIAGKISRAHRAGDPRFVKRPSRNAGRRDHVSDEPQGSPLAAKSPLEAVRGPRVDEGRPEGALTAATEPARPRLLVDLDPADCRWPVGEAPDGRHLFCGRPQAPGRLYCAQCCARVSPSPSPSLPFRAPVLRRGGA